MRGYLGTCCSAGLSLLLFQAVQFATEAVILLAVQAGFGTARIQCTTQVCSCSQGNTAVNVMTKRLDSRARTSVILWELPESKS